MSEFPVHQDIICQYVSFFTYWSWFLSDSEHAVQSDHDVLAKFPQGSKQVASNHLAMAYPCIHVGLLALAVVAIFSPGLGWLHGLKPHTALGPRRGRSRLSRLDATQRLAQPMDGFWFLDVGSVVGYELDVPGHFLHAGIYLGPGDQQLEADTGLSLNPETHYVIEYSGPNRFSGSPPSTRGRVVSGVFSGKGGQNIWITEMKPSTQWFAFEVFSGKYDGERFSGQETKRRESTNSTTFPFHGFHEASDLPCRFIAKMMSCRRELKECGTRCGTKSPRTRISGLLVWGITSSVW